MNTSRWYISTPLSVELLQKVIKAHKQTADGQALQFVEIETEEFESLACQLRHHHILEPDDTLRLAGIELRKKDGASKGFITLFYR